MVTRLDSVSSPGVKLPVSHDANTPRCWKRVIEEYYGCMHMSVICYATILRMNDLS